MSRSPTLSDLCMKAIFDNQQNLNILVKVLNQQIVYINSFLQQIENQNDVSTTIKPRISEQSTTTGTITDDSSNSNNNNDQVTENTRGGGTEPTITDQSTNNEHVTKEDKNI